jgi:hypothetical protein
VFGKSQILGETGCAADTPVASLCRPEWPAISVLLAPADPPPASSTTDGGQGGMPEPGAAAQPPERRAGCSLGGRTRGAGVGWLLPLAAALIVRRRFDR